MDGQHAAQRIRNLQRPAHRRQPMLPDQLRTGAQLEALDDGRVFPDEIPEALAVVGFRVEVLRMQLRGLAFRGNVQRQEDPHPALVHHRADERLAGFHAGAARVDDARDPHRQQRRLRLAAERRAAEGHMGMVIDQPRRHQASRGVDGGLRAHLLACFRRDDPVAADKHIARPRHPPRGIDDGAATDQQVRPDHGPVLPGFAWLHLRQEPVRGRGSSRKPPPCVARACFPAGTTGRHPSIPINDGNGRSGGIRTHDPQSPRQRQGILPPIASGSMRWLPVTFLP